MISLRARLIRLVSKRLFSKLSPEVDIGELRTNFEKMASRNSIAAGTSIRHATLGGVDCDWLVPQGCDESRVLLYLHGGAYVSGSSRTHRAMVSYIAKEAGMRALLPNYRLAPESPFPAGLEDCIAVYRALVVAGCRPEQMAIAGDSAGGGMTMATLLSLRDAGDPMPSVACLLSPWLDLAADGESIRTRDEHDPWFQGVDMPRVAAHYCADHRVREPLISPVYADVHGLPPMLIQVGDHEILLSDSTRLNDRILSAGGRATLQVWPHMWHVFQYFVGRMPESKRAIDDIGAYLRKELEAAPTRSASSRAA